MEFYVADTLAKALNNDNLPPNTTNMTLEQPNVNYVTSPDKRAIELS